MSKKMVALLLSFFAWSPVIMALKVGDFVPNFSLPNQNKEFWNLEEELAQPGCKGVVVTFFPKSGTSVCTKQACGLRNNHNTLKNMGVTAVMINYESPEVHTKWIQDEGLRGDILTDASGNVARIFGANNPWVLNQWPKRQSLFISKKKKVEFQFPDSATSATPSEVIVSTVREILGKESAK